MAPQPMEIPPPAPEGATPAQITAAENAREAARLHNVTVDNDRITAATVIGTTIGEIARVTRPPPRPTKPTIKMDMPDPYEGDPAKISNWIRSMEIQALSQGTTPVEDYIIRFKSIAPLTGFNNYALVAHFKAGLNPSLGFEVIKNGAPADDNLDAWYDHSTELAQGYRDVKKTFGDHRCRNDCTAQPKTSSSESTPIMSTSRTTETPRDPNAMDID
ncbi:hypothetical protein AX14_001337 [Amanita brunnescens Koide BX004]|nr:hypothetical protein AX14_001337 [Amanita brunnescens Koide BX004]